MPAGFRHGVRCRRIAAIAIASLGSLMPMAPGVAAQRQEAGEQAIKAAFLYNFTKFVEWPESAFAAPSSPFVVCVIADEMFTRELAAVLRGEQVRDRPIEVVVPDTDASLTGCHMVYFGRGDTSAERRLPVLRQAPVLTVGEGRRFLQQGGLIAFLVEKDRVRFHISKRGADAVRLTISSKLLRVAADVVGAPAP